MQNGQLDLRNDIEGHQQQKWQIWEIQIKQFETV